MYAKEAGGYIMPSYPSIPVNMMSFLPSAVYLQENNLQSKNDIESSAQNQRRKMMRRAANRRSAQLSRARKKVIYLQSRNIFINSLI